MSDLMQNKYFRAGLGILLVFLIIYVASKIWFIFTPIVIIVKTLFPPLLISFFLYFLLHPLVDVLERNKIPRLASILILYGAAIGLVILLLLLIGPILQREVVELIDDAPVIVNELRRQLIALQENPLFARLQHEIMSIEDLADKTANTINYLLNLLQRNIASIAEITANIMLVLITIPFILFYLLKDGKHWPETVSRLLPKKYSSDLKGTLQEINQAISSYIQGLVFVSLCVGVLIYIGYIIIGLEYSLILALFAMITNLVPFFGPFIGTIPGVIVGLLDSPMMMLQVIIVALVVQQVESMVISPQVMGKKLKISPLAVILVILVAGRMAGLLGMILALPTYMVLKIIVNHIYKPQEEPKKASSKISK